MHAWNRLTYQEKIALQSLLGTAVVVGVKTYKGKKLARRKRQNLKTVAHIYANLTEFRTYVDDILMKMEFENIVSHMND